MYKKYYQKFINANPNVQHYAAHSHHYWPDITRQAMVQYWDDSAKYVDDKWSYFFSKMVPETQQLIADVLNISHPKQIVFAPNTHEFVYRLLSCFPHRKTIKILTTDSEFYSFDRQINRLTETTTVEVEKIATEPFDSFEARFIEKIKNTDFDLIFFSQVFFNSGFAINDLKKIVQSVRNSETQIVVDGYHGFMALPTDLSSIEDRIFYLAGSYKYAQGGEGCCFLVVPKNCQLQPTYTGWFAGFADLANSVKKDKVSYADDGYRFAGSTMDFSALYRLHAVLSLFKQDNLTVSKIHLDIQNKQENFLKHLDQVKLPFLKLDQLLKFNSKNQHGHFFTFNLDSSEDAAKIAALLKENKIVTDYRKNRLRFGFGLYQESCIDLTSLQNKNV